MQWVARQVLNMSLSQKILSKQEAMVHISKLNLFLCSETIEKVSLSNYYKLKENGSESKNIGKHFLRQYATRSGLEDVSMDEYYLKFKSKLFYHG